jgi:hypothetical protein
MNVFYNLSKTTPHTFLTPLGREIKGMILDSQLQLNLSYPLGCSPHLYTVGAPMNLANHSLYYLYIQQIIPTQVFNYSLTNTQFFISNTASLRYDLFPGLVNNNDIYTISPFNDVFYCFFNMSGVELQQLTNYVTVNSSLAAEHAKKFGRVAYEHGRAPGSPGKMTSIPHAPSSPYFYSDTKINPNAYYDVVASQYDAASLTPVIEMLFPQNGPIKAVPYPTERTSTDALAEFVLTQWPCRPDCPCSS